MINSIDGLGIESALAVQAENRAAEEEVGQSQFLEMLVAQLENQDPLNPQDSADFAAQLAQFSTVEQLVAMRAGIDELVTATQASGGGSAFGASLDPASLVGRDVTVIGSQIEVPADQSPATMSFRTIDTAAKATVKIFDNEGKLVREESVLPRDPQNREYALAAGDHEYVLDPVSLNLPPGVYGIEFSGTSATDEPVTMLPLVEGRVTSAVLAGQPSIRIGNRIFPVEDVLEVRLADGAATSVAGGGSGSAPIVGGGQSVFAPRTPPSLIRPEGV